MRLLVSKFTSQKLECLLKLQLGSLIVGNPTQPRYTEWKEIVGP